MDNASIAKFKDLITKSLKDTKSKLGNDKKAFSVYSELLKAIEEKDLEKLVTLKKYIPEFEERITEFEKTIKYLIDNELDNTPQYKKIEELLFGSEIKEHIGLLQERKEKEIEKKEQRVLELKKLNGTDYSNSFLYEFLSNGSFTEQEELDVLMYFIYVTCDKKEQIEEVVEEEKESINLDEIKEEYEKIRAIAHNVLDNASYEFKEMDTELKNYIKSYLKILEEEKETIDERTVLVNNFTYSDIKRIASLFNVESNVKYVENVLYGDEEVDEDSIEVLRMLISDIKENIKIDIKSSNDLKENDKEINNAEPSNVSILLDEEDNPYIDEKAKTEQAYAIKKLIEKLEQGIYDVDKGIKHTIFQTEYDKNKVFVNRYTTLDCAYIRVDDTRVIIISIDPQKNFFKNVEKVLNKEEEKIEEYKQLIIDNDTNFISKQNEQIYNLKGAYINER